MASHGGENNAARQTYERNIKNNIKHRIAFYLCASRSVNGVAGGISGALSRGWHIWRASRRSRRQTYGTATCDSQAASPSRQSWLTLALSGNDFAERQHRAALYRKRLKETIIVETRRISSYRFPLAFRAPLHRKNSPYRGNIAACRLTAPSPLFSMGVKQKGRKRREEEKRRERSASAQQLCCRAMYKQHRVNALDGVIGAADHGYGEKRVCGTRLGNMRRHARDARSRGAGIAEDAVGAARDVRLLIMRDRG